MEKDLEEMKKQTDAINTFISMLAEDENAPLDFKILHEDNKNKKLFHEIMGNKNFLNLSNDSEEKKSLYAFLQQQTEFLTDLKKKID